MFCPLNYTTNVLKFVHKFKLNKLTSVFNNYFKNKSDECPNTRQRTDFMIPKITSEQGKKIINYLGAYTWNHIKSKLQTTSCLNIDGTSLK